MTIKQLIESGQFLHLSRTNPASFEEPMEFKLTNHTQVNIYAAGIISFCPEQPGSKDIVLSSGIHGNETAPIEICDELVQQVLTGKLQLAHRVLFIFGNLPSMDLAERFVEENMNRLFCGEHSNPPGLVNQERHRAKLLEQEVSRFYGDGDKFGVRERRHYDLHTAIRTSKNEKFAVYPFTHGKPRKKSQLQFMLACGVNTILLSGSPTTTFSYFSAVNFGADAFTVELGKVKAFGQNDMSQFADVKRTLLGLLSEPDLQLKDYAADDFLIYKVNQVINKQQSDFRLNFSEDEPNFSDFAAGTLLAEESGKQYHAQFDGEAIVFPNANVALGQRALLTVVPTTL
jgi:succinylglutamate desuccinylase